MAWVLSEATDYTQNCTMINEASNSNSDPLLKGETGSLAREKEGLSLLSSMAPRLILEELLSEYTKETGINTTLDAIGGADASKRIKLGEQFDIVVLSQDSIKQLSEAGHLGPESVDIAISQVAIAVKAGAPHPDLSSEQAVKSAVSNASSISYSTGPSGRAIAGMFEKWGIAQAVSDRLATPPPGIPVGSLVANGEAEIGFQQLSELIHVEGIDIVGNLPDEIRVDTVFSAGRPTASSRDKEAKGLLDFLTSSKAEAAIRQQGMQPAR